MTDLIISYRRKFEKEIKLQKKRGKNISKLKQVITLLASGKPLPEKYRNHKLTGNYRDHWECHIEPCALKNGPRKGFKEEPVGSSLHFLLEYGNGYQFQ